jgi:hypothetical protein
LFPLPSKHHQYELGERANVDAEALAAGGARLDQRGPSPDMRVQDQVSGLCENLNGRAREDGREPGRVFVESRGSGHARVRQSRAAAMKAACASSERRTNFCPFRRAMINKSPMYG